MKRWFNTLIRAQFVLLGIALFLVGCASHNQYIDEATYPHKIKVACVGDSITFGAGIKDRQKNSYPTQLGNMLGKKWQVVNFGHSARTLLKKGDYPYWKSPQFKKALAFNPDIVIIKLGTNDTKPQNWKHSGEFVTDYTDMIEAFKKLPSHPKIWICYPVPAYPERWGIKDTVIKNEVIPKIDEIAKVTNVNIIKLYEPLSGKPQLFPDKIHPNAQGAKLMAQEIYQTLTGKKHK